MLPAIKESSCKRRKLAWAYPQCIPWATKTAEKDARPLIGVWCKTWRRRSRDEHRKAQTSPTSSRQVERRGRGGPLLLSSQRGHTHRICGWALHGQNCESTQRLLVRDRVGIDSPLAWTEVRPGSAKSPAKCHCDRVSLTVGWWCYGYKVG